MIIEFNLIVEWIVLFATPHPSKKLLNLRKDGKVTMIKSAELIGDTNLVDSLKKDMVSLVHKYCQVKFYKKAKSFQMPSINLEKKALRSKYSFEWKKIVFCADYL